MKKYIASIHKAAEQTATVMTHQVRQHASKSGWTPEAADSLNVKYVDGKFVAHSSSGDAFTHEYGSETSRPTAAVRKFSSQSNKISGPFFANILSSNLAKGRKK